jgi:AcrR family transcriptional regulator
MAQLGRPRGTKSEDTRRKIIDTAREIFASRGFQATPIASLAEAVGLAPSAIYHYFGGKTELYETVFEETVEAIWSDVGAAVLTHDTLYDNMVALVADSRHLGETRPHHSDFLALVPMEARLQPEFAHLLERRAKYQDDTFSSLADIGIATGELAGFSRTEATEILRSLVMGWFFERHFRGAEIPGSGEALIALVGALAGR